MNPTRSIAAAIVAATLAHGAAFAAPPPLPPGPGAMFAAYDQARGKVAAAVEAITDNLGHPGWVVDLTLALGAELHTAGEGSREWLVQIVAPVLDAPPDLTCLRAYPVPEHTTSGFGWRDDPIRHRSQFHGGADIHADRGTPVHVAGDGTVIFAARQGGYGNVIFVDHGRGLITRYGHLSKILVKKGEIVTAATEIGRVGATGRATGPHLHFEVRIDGRPVDPSLAMRVADLERTAPDLARLVGLALAPDVQSHWIDDQDPPRPPRSKKPSGPRPERRGRAQRSRNTT
jgi:murein DD-endopeptidase MepM/ murein hydrolase activator NlpD